MTKESPKKLWNPKYAALGVLIVVLSVFFLDTLPRMVRDRLDRETDPENQEEPFNLESLIPSEPQ